MEMNKQLLSAILRTDFKSFVIKVFNTVSAGSEYLDNWHVDVICDELMNMRDGKNNRLILNVPPRYLKSIICSVALPAFLLGRDPTIEIICVSYSDDLATKFANDFRNVMTSDWYRELFPMTHLANNATNDLRTTRSGGRMATSICGTLTGRGADWIIIDDPLKPMDAMSDIQRDKVNEWYGSTLYSRLNDKNMGKIVLIMQRLHMNDLTGFLIESGGNFKHIRFPMIAEEFETWIIKNRIVTRHPGDLLHPERDGPDIVNELKNSVGEYGFAGQFQQRPVPIEGGIVKEKWLQYYDIRTVEQIDPLKYHRIFISWDTANKTGTNNDYSACCVMLMTRDDKFYLLDVIRGRWEAPELLDKMIDLYNYWKHDRGGGHHVQMLIEDKASGTQLIQILNANTDRSGYPFNLVAIKPNSDKVSRLHGASIFIEKGVVLFPMHDEPWWPEFKNELLNFPGCKFDDQVDALSQCITFPQKEAN